MAGPWTVMEGTGVWGGDGGVYGHNVVISNMRDGTQDAYTELVGQKVDTLNSVWRDDKSSFGFKMMLKMGWSEGRGLGKELQGSATHVKVMKKTDSAGLGAVKDDTGNVGWVAASASFDSVLSQLNAKYGVQPAQTKVTKDKKVKKAKKRNGADEASKQRENVSGRASMLFRHPKLLKSKNIKQYSADDMSAILGVKRKDHPEDPWLGAATAASAVESATVRKGQVQSEEPEGSPPKKRRRLSLDGIDAMEVKKASGVTEDIDARQAKKKKERERRRKERKVVEEGGSMEDAVGDVVPEQLKASKGKRKKSKAGKVKE